MSGSELFVLECYDPTKEYHGQKQFDCGNQIINAFVAKSLRKQVRESLSRCFVLLDAGDNDRFIGFYTLSSFAILAPDLMAVKSSGLPSRVPCVRLIMLGVDKHYQGRGLGRRLMKSVFEKTLAVSERIGLYGLYLDADAQAVEFYIALGFVPLRTRDASRPTPMLMHIEAIRAATR
ncbi:MAG: GNAT family N-acetyltransferase [Gammaproteobacteria bacterium]|nr:GNAT family N-acetyltransferase [Gammaproteobacteria bacterium]